MAFKTVMVDSSVSLAGERYGISRQIVRLFKNLRRRPMPDGVDFKAYSNARDPRFRVARVNQFYRAILWEIDSSTLFISHIVDHDRPNLMASSLALKRIKRDDAIIVVDYSDSQPDSVGSQGNDTEDPVTPVLSIIPESLKDQTLMQFGLSEDLIAVVRGMHNPQALEALERLLPQSMRPLFAVQLVLEGHTPDEAFREVATLDDATIHAAVHPAPDALVKRIENLGVHVLRSEADVAKALSCPWDQWKRFLHPLQRQLAYSTGYQGPFRVTGGPGTGKTIVAIHRVRALVGQSDFERSRDEVLLTTFNKTLSAQNEELLGQLLSDEQRSRVRVVGLDKLVHEILEANRGDGRALTLLNEVQIDQTLETIFQRHPPPNGWTSKRVREFWTHVLLGLDQYEWDTFNEIQDRTGLPRTGRSEFAAVVAIVNRLEVRLQKERQTTFQLRVRSALELVKANGTPKFRHIVVDEGQDFSPLQWRLIRALAPEAPNDIFLVADPDQRLYGIPFSLSYAGIDIRGRSRRLHQAYRASAEILAFAYHIIADQRGDDPDDQSSSVLAARPSKSVFSGPQPTAHGAASEQEELKNLVSLLRRWKSRGLDWSEILVTCASSRLQDPVLAMLREADIPCSHVANAIAKGDPEPGTVRVMTMHRSKGMEARAMVLFGAGLSAYERQKAEGPIREAQHRYALFVACSRPRELLHVSWHGEPSPMLTDALQSIAPR